MAADRRLAAVMAQLRAAEEDMQPLPVPPSMMASASAFSPAHQPSPQLARAATAAASGGDEPLPYDAEADPYVRFMPADGPYAVPLPEHLGPDARWDVYR
jgi:hypothetical protein